MPSRGTSAGMDDQVWLVARIVSALAVLVTAVLAFKAWRFTSGAARAPGRIRRFEREESETMSYGADHPAQTHVSFRPHVEFTDASGASVTFASRVAHASQPQLEIGEDVTVVYDPANPAGTAEILGPAVWRNSIFAGCGTVVVVLFTVIARACG